ncbi:hypothetical protein DBR11_16375 [Pedobacter sp. HMWF019]|nr:hypothetical protein DBR11_16375 [Pedobacter sp. HMWF019]
MSYAKGKKNEDKSGIALRGLESLPRFALMAKPPEVRSEQPRICWAHTCHFLYFGLTHRQRDRMWGGHTGIFHNWHSSMQTNWPTCLLTYRQARYNIT